MAAKDPNRKGIRFSDEELELFTAVMKRDGMSALTTWMKSVCSRYANGHLVPRATRNKDGYDLDVTEEDGKTVLRLIEPDDDGAKD